MKNIEISFREDLILEKLYNNIKEMYEESVDRENEGVERLLRKGHEPEEFDAQEFVNLYQQALNNQTEAGNQSILKLDGHLRDYTNACLKNLINLQNSIGCE